MSDSVYQKLQGMLDRFPLGYPQTESGVELEILKRLYTPEEASIALMLRPKPEEPSAIAARMNGNESEIARKLAAMAVKGLAFRSERGGKLLYNAIPFMIGLYEYSVKRIDKELAGLFKQYYDEAYQTEMGVSNIPGFKVVPIQKFIDGNIALYPYQKIEEDIRSARVIAVSECVCRKEAKLLGHGCDRPMETCLSFGAAAEYYINSGIGRAIEADEAIAIVKKADDAGLVHAGANAKHLSNICNCCPCCCASMKGIVQKGHNKRKYLNALFEPIIGADLCTACGMCLDRCPVKAIEVDDMATFDPERCVGCGLCASGCPSEAITMLPRKSIDEPYESAHALFSSILAAKNQQIQK
ncbi:MAG: 4Fe-4S dicluster domain-containing protein [Desulfobacteraceae bacterium]|nr:MAG: 4Fe-4S dicluster domain-containing protein [Desulfobacteraceae bacterium]